MIRLLLKVNSNTAAWFLLFGLLIFSATSCRTKSKKTSVSLFEAGKFDEDAVADGIEAYYSNKPFDDTAWVKKPLQTVDAVMQYAYRSYEYLPLWLNENGNSVTAHNLLDDLAALSTDGINPERYGLSKLQQQLQDFDSNKKTEVKALVTLDTQLTHAWLQAAYDLQFGLVLPKQVDSLWYHANDSAWNPSAYIADALYKDNAYPALDTFRSKMDLYDKLRKLRGVYTRLEKDEQLQAAKAAYTAGNLSDSLVDYIISAEVPESYISQADTLDAKVRKIKAFQSYYALPLTGKIDSATLSYLQRNPAEAGKAIDVNLERLRWLPASFEDTYVLVNTALCELYLYNKGQIGMHMRVVVGKNARQTPSLNANMANVVINPSWGVPPTILKKDVLPGMQKSGSAYLAKKDLKVYDHKGNPVDPSQVNASNYKRFVFRQPPGDDNALGYVKFNLPNKWDIYLHDTPHRELFAKEDRAWSSGCIRVEQPKEMAIYILHEMEDMRYTPERLDSVIATAKTRYVTLKNKIPVHVIYITATEGNNGDVRFLRDFYRRDAKLSAMLDKK
jgi:L,D-transpeptidase YcbB